LKKAPQSPAKYPYLTVSDNVHDPADVLTINDFRRVKEKLKKKVKKGTGLEVAIAPARKMDAVGIGKWFESVADLHSFCQSSRCQFIISSGARSMHEMVSGPCIDAILKNCDIDQHRHWREMNSWLEAMVSRRASV
jgi:sugar-specific transcriptional regulator TrmB